MPNLKGILRFPSLTQVFGIDLRALAAFRICVALIFLIDLAYRACDLEAHYSDLGVLPRGAILGVLGQNEWFFSLHYINGTVGFQALLFLVAALATFSLLIGYRTKISTVLTWIFLVSLHERNTLLTHMGDDLIRILLFWSIFLPLGRVWSIDALHSREHSKDTTSSERPVCSVASVGVFLQIYIVYFFAVLHRTHEAWHTSGKALELALRNDHYLWPLGRELLNYPELMQALTFFSLGLELFGPLLAFSPIFHAPLRILTCFLFFGFHLLGIGLTMRIGLIPLQCAVAWILFLPGLFWDSHFWVKSGTLYRRYFEDLFKKLVRVFARPMAFLKKLPSSASDFAKPTLSKRFMLGVGQYLLAVLIVYNLLWNVREVDTKYQDILPVNLNWVGFVTHLYQRWDMFAPAPPLHDGWYVIPGKLRNGEEVDIFRAGAPITWEKPARTFSRHNKRWREYLMRLIKPGNITHATLYANYLCRTWNEEASLGRELMNLEIYFMLELTQTDGSELPAEKFRIASKTCLRHEVS